MKKRFWCILPALCLTLALLTATALAAGEEAETESDAAAAQGGEDLFYQYMLQLAREQTTSVLMRDQVDTAGSRLTGDDLLVYNQLVPQIRSAARNGGSTTFSATLQNSAAGYRSRPAVNALMADMPYDLYWFDKTAGWGTMTSGTRVEITFTVAEEYRNGSESVLIAPGERVTTAINTANAVVSANASKSDYRKLAAYKAWICENVDYNHAAADDNSTPYGNPWQMVYVFDGDPETNVVCEGYSKAFKFLCDLSDFQGDVQCYLTEGSMTTGGSAGGHMWNTVVIGGKSYLADVTNCDQKSGIIDSLFLKGVAIPAEGEPAYESGVSFYVVVTSRTTFYYWYDDELPWENDILALSTTDYEPPALVWTPVTGGGYEYCLDGGTLHVRPTNGSAYLILARYEGGRMTEAKVWSVFSEYSAGPLTPGSWRVFSVDSRMSYIPQGTPLELLVSG